MRHRYPVQLGVRVEESAMGAVRVVKASSHGELAWTEVPRPEGDTAPPGEEVVSYRSGDGRFVAGFWRRVPEEGRMDMDTYTEIALILEGDVEVTEDDGTVHRAGPGDLLITPRGTRATWHSRTPVKKLWAIYKGD